MIARILQRLLAGALLAVASAGCCKPFFEVRSADGWSYRVISAPQLDVSTVDARGFLDADTCDFACSGAKACYPATVRSPSFPRVPRKILCKMAFNAPRPGAATGFEATLDLTPAEEASTKIGAAGDIDPTACELVCGAHETRSWPDPQPAHGASCKALPPPPPVVGPDEVFVVCGRYTPPRCVERALFGSGGE